MKRCIVFKVGTSTLTHKTGLLNLGRIEKLVRILSDVKNSGLDVILVTSGAIAVGMSKLSMTNRPSEIRYKQSLAAVGQCELIHIYDKLFLSYGQVVGQVLITKADIASEEKRENIIATMNTMLELGVIPIINENDTTGYDEILFGDNDTLSAEVMVLSGAKELIILSDIDGLYDSDPHVNPCAKLITHVTEINEEIYKIAGCPTSKVGTGGMITKIHAAEIVLNAGGSMIIMNGKNPDKIYDVIAGQEFGTRFSRAMQEV